MSKSFFDPRDRKRKKQRAMPNVHYNFCETSHDKIDTTVIFCSARNTIRTSMFTQISFWDGQLITFENEMYFSAIVRRKNWYWCKCSTYSWYNHLILNEFPHNRQQARDSRKVSVHNQDWWKSPIFDKFAHATTKIRLEKFTAYGPGRTLEWISMSFCNEILSKICFVDHFRTSLAEFPQKGEFYVAFQLSEKTFDFFISVTLWSWNPPTSKTYYHALFSEVERINAGFENGHVIVKQNGTLFCSLSEASESPVSLLLGHFFT